MYLWTVRSSGRKLCRLHKNLRMSSVIYQEGWRFKGCLNPNFDLSSLQAWLAHSAVLTPSMSSYPSSSKLASPEHSHTPLSQSLPASTGPLRGTSPSAAARLRARSRRLSVRQSRGQTEYGFYERLYPQYPEYGDTYDGPLPFNLIAAL